MTVETGSVFSDREDVTSWEYVSKLVMEKVAYRDATHKKIAW